MPLRPGARLPQPAKPRVSRRGFAPGLENSPAKVPSRTGRGKVPCQALRIGDDRSHALGRREALEGVAAVLTAPPQAALLAGGQDVRIGAARVLRRARPHVAGIVAGSRVTDSGPGGFQGAPECGSYAHELFNLAMLYHLQLTPAVARIGRGARRGEVKSVLLCLRRGARASAPTSGMFAALTFPNHVDSDVM